jgi:hypothetical protein
MIVQYVQESAPRYPGCGGHADGECYFGLFQVGQGLENFMNITLIRTWFRIRTGLGCEKNCLHFLAMK